VFLKRRADEGLLETEDIGRLVHWITATKEPELLAHDVGKQPSASSAAFA
jgi:hypothetical protein